MSPPSVGVLFAESALPLRITRLMVIYIVNFRISRIYWLTCRDEPREIRSNWDFLQQIKKTGLKRIKIPDCVGWGPKRFVATYYQHHASVLLFYVSTGWAESSATGRVSIGYSVDTFKPSSSPVKGIRRGTKAWYLSEVSPVKLLHRRTLSEGFSVRTVGEQFSAEDRSTKIFLQKKE